MKVSTYNLSALFEFKGNESIPVRGEERLNSLPDLNARENTNISSTESYSGIPGIDSVFL